MINVLPRWSIIKIAPCWCRILAKTKDTKTGKERLMTDRELMQRTGWGKKHLRSVYNRATWDKITNGDMDLFLWACGMQPSKQRRYVYLLKRACEGGRIRRLRHLGAAVAWRENQVQTLLRMCERVLKNELDGG